MKRLITIGALLALAAPLAAQAADGQWLPDGEPFAAPASGISRRRAMCCAAAGSPRST